MTPRVCPRSGPATPLMRQRGRSPNVDPDEHRQEATRRDDASTTAPKTAYERVAPGASSITPVASHGSKRKGRPSQDRLDVPTARRAIDMSPHNDRCTSQAPAAPYQDQPDTVVIQRSSGSIRRVSKAHHRAPMTGFIRNREEQNHPRTGGVKGIWRNSCPFDTASWAQYWGRRRYGPVSWGFAVA
jgi:hypothetical protein